jgi:hypothetical protein
MEIEIDARREQRSGHDQAGRSGTDDADLRGR